MLSRQIVRSSPEAHGQRTEKVHGAAQVCALQWSRHEKEILSSHGFSQNQLCLWKYPSMAKVCPCAPECAPWSAASTLQHDLLSPVKIPPMQAAG